MLSVGKGQGAFTQVGRFFPFLMVFLVLVACQGDPPVVSVTPVLSLETVEKSAPEWSRNAAIYEVNIRQYSEEGTLNEFRKSLPRLKRLGVKILWLMPVQPIGEKNRKGELGSYYSIRDYTGVNPEFGDLGDFKRLVREAHDEGMYVILDWVANHSAWDNDWARKHPDWYTQDSTGNMMPPVPDWHDVADLNYEKAGLRAAMMEAMAYWVRETDLDGFRCDVAEMVPMDFWRAVRQRLDGIKPVFMLAEGAVPELHQAFDMTYSWRVHQMMNAIAQGKKDATDLSALLMEESAEFPPDAYRMQFTSNHDENSWNGTVFERLGGGAETFAVLSAVIPGMPLIYSGQEAGLDKRLSFFDKDFIAWKSHPMFGIYQLLLAEKAVNKALWNGEAGGQLKQLPTDREKSVFAFVREKEGYAVLAVFNLGKTARDLKISGQIQPGTYRGLYQEEEIVVAPGSELAFNLPAWGYKVLVRHPQ